MVRINISMDADSEYPVCSVPLEPSDRFLLYTDGVTELRTPLGRRLATGNWNESYAIIDCSPPPSCPVRCSPNSRRGDLLP